MKKLWANSNRKLGDFLQSMCFSGPSFLGMLLFYVVPFGVVVYYSFIAGAMDHSFVGFQNYKNVLENGAYKIAVHNTVVFSALSVPLAVVLSLLMALMLECRIPWKSQFRTFFLSPMMVPVASDHPRLAGALPRQRRRERVPGRLRRDGHRLAQIRLLHGRHRGAVSVEKPRLQHDPVHGGAQQHPQDAARGRGGRGRHGRLQFFHIKLRYLSPTMLFVTILSIINSFKVFREVYLLTGDYPYDKLYMLQHFMNNMFNNLDYQKLSAAAVVLALVIVGCWRILFRR
jgi:multiple sugar transport system permease protein